VCLVSESGVQCFCSSLHRDGDPWTWGPVGTLELHAQTSPESEGRGRQSKWWAPPSTLPRSTPTRLAFVRLLIFTLNQALLFACLLALCYCSCFQTAMALDRLINLQICPHSVFYLPSPKHIPTCTLTEPVEFFQWIYSLRCCWLPPPLWNSIASIRDFKWTTSTGSLLRVRTSPMAQF
jgi:hypothetical protein